MKLRTTVLAIAATAVTLASAPSALAKGTLFVVGSGSSTVAAHSIGPAGGLTPIGAAVATGNTPRSAAVSPNAQYLFVSSVGADNITIYSIAGAGNLSQIGTAATGTDPEGIAISPNGSFLYVANQGSNNISGFALTAGGNLVPLDGSPYPAAQVREIAITGNGRHLYASTDAGVRSYDIAQATGALTSIGGVTAAGTNPKGLATTPDSRFLYVTNTGSNDISGYSIGGTGELTPIGVTGTGAVPQTVSVTGDGRFLYNANFGAGDNVGGFAIGADGALTPLSGQPYPAGTQPYGIDAAPNSANVYVSNFNNNMASSVFGYSIPGGAGPLSALAGSPFASEVSGSEFQSIAITPNQGPTALFTAESPGAGSPAKFNATSSSDRDGGTVARFDWDFGDGTTLPNGGPRPEHTYAQPGNYNVTLLVTDDEGCSITPIFTGQTADCNPGTPPALLTQTLQVGTGTAPDLKLSGKEKQELAKTVVVKAKTAEATDAVAKGNLVVKSGKNKKIALKSFSLKKDKKALNPNQKTKLKPKLPSKGFKNAKKALKKGGKVTAKVTVKVTDADADTEKDSLKIKLKK